MVLIQDSKGDASGLLGSSGGQSVFGSTGASSFIVKATRVVAALFAVGCIGLAYLTSNQANTSGVFDRVSTPVTPSTQNVETTTQTPVEAPLEAPAATTTPTETMEQKTEKPAENKSAQ